MKKVIIFFIFLMLSSKVTFSRQDNIEYQKNRNTFKSILDSLKEVNTIPTDILLSPPSLFSPKTSINSISCENSLRTNLRLEDRIRNCPTLLSHIVWEYGNGSRVSYINWTSEQKNKLNMFFDALMHGDSTLDIQCPNPTRNIAAVPVRQFFLTAEEAFDIYTAHIAHILYLEVTHRVPWSVLNLPDIQLKELFDSSSYHDRITGHLQSYFPSHIRPDRDYQIPFRNIHSPSYICDPRIGFKFLNGETSRLRRSLIGVTPRETMANISNWARNTIVHDDTLNAISRESLIRNAFLDQRLSSHDGIPGLVVFGCHGAANIIQDLARSVNIPLLNVASQTSNSTFGSLEGRMHRGLVFNAGTSEVKVLQSADDLHAIDSEDFYPVNSSGIRLFNEREIADLFFDTYWVSPSQLENWGFQTYRDFPIIFPGIGFGEIRLPDGSLASISEENYSNYGNFLGYWRYSNNRQALDAYLLEKQFNLCGWQLIHDYCSTDPDTFFNNYSSYTTYTDGYSPFIRRTRYDFWNRASQCIYAYGRECSEIIEQHNSWLRDFGLNVIR